MVDIGANLTHTLFKTDLADVVSRSFDSGLMSIIITGTSITGSEEAVQICEKFKKYKIYCTVGIHPHDSKHYNLNADDDLRSLIQKNKCVKAVGETGLDFFRDRSPRDAQISSFEGHIKIAISFNLPLFLHERAAHEKMIEILDKYKGKLGNVVIHCFTGNAEQALNYIKRGFYIGVTGWIFDERRNQGLLEALPHIPLDRLMIETDSPFLSPNRKDNRNVPSNVLKVANKIGRILGKTEREIVSLTTQNANRFFALEHFSAVVQPEEPPIQVNRGIQPSGISPWYNSRLSGGGLDSDKELKAHQVSYSKRTKASSSSRDFSLNPDDFPAL